MLVIGGTGPTGIPLVRGLVDRGADVTILHRGLHERDETPDVVTHLHADPYDEDALRAVFAESTFDVVFAMYGRLRRIAQFSAGRVGQFVSVGGVPAYRGWMNPWIPMPLPVDESAATVSDPAEDEKGFRIARTEAAVFAHHPRAAHFRYPYVYGPHQLAPREWIVVRRILDGRDHIVVADDGLTLHHHGYTENLAHAVLLAVEQPDAAAGKVFNVGDEEVLTVRQVIEVIAAALSHQLEIVSMPYDIALPARPLLAQPSPAHRVLDLTRVRTELHYRDAVPARVALAATARWLAANPCERGGQEEMVLTRSLRLRGRRPPDRRVAARDRLCRATPVRGAARLRARVQRTGRSTTDEPRVPGVSARPLAGIKVVDLSIALTGPYAVALLADQGAEVIKVERPGFGDIGRYVGVSVNGLSALAQMCNRGKRSLALDVHDPEGREILLHLTDSADVVVQNFRPGVVERLGIDDAAVRARNADVIYVSLSGFGPVGPYASKGAYDTVIQAYGGFASNQLDSVTGEPRFLNQTAADKVTALYASQAITAALFARERGDGGTHIQLSMLDAVVSFLWADAAGNEVLQDADRSQPSSFVQNFRPFRFVDGWGICTPTSDADFAGMCKALGVDGYDDPRVATITQRSQHRELAGAILQRCYGAAAMLTTAEAIRRLEAHNVPCGVVTAPADLAADPHARTIGLFEESIHPVAGRLRQPRHPASFGDDRPAIGAPAPMLGEHSDEILRELGLADRIRDLRERGIVG